MNESKRMRGIEIHMQSAVQEYFNFTVATIDNLEPLLNRQSPLSEAAIAHGPLIEFELFKDDRTAVENTFSFCCAHGQVQARRMLQPPTPFDDLLTAQTPAANQFMFLLQAACRPQRNVVECITAWASFTS